MLPGTIEAQAQTTTNPCGESYAARSGSVGNQQIVEGDADELEHNKNCEFYTGHLEAGNNDIDGN